MVSVLRCPDLHLHIQCENGRIQASLAHAYTVYWYVCKSIFKRAFLPLSALYTELNVTFEELNLVSGLNIIPRTSPPSQPQLLA